MQCLVRLVDNSGDTVVEYTYDGWGKVIAAASSLTTVPLCYGRW